MLGGRRSSRRWWCFVSLHCRATRPGCRRLGRGRAVAMNVGRWCLDGRGGLIAGGRLRRGRRSGAQDRHRAEHRGECRSSNHDETLAVSPSISDPVDTCVFGGACRDCGLQPIGVDAGGQQQVSVALDVQKRICCMQCIVRLTDGQSAATVADIMVSVVLETCVARPLMDMTRQPGARAMPAASRRKSAVSCD